jgi:hypothetical protein
LKSRSAAVLCYPLCPEHGRYSAAGLPRGGKSQPSSAAENSHRKNESPMSTSKATDRPPSPRAMTPRRRPYTRRRPRRLHALLVGEHGDFRGSLLLGKSHQPLQRRQCLRPGCPERLFWRELSSPAELGRAGVSQLIYYNTVDKGGHYAAWEQPQLFPEEVCAGFRPLRK